MQGEDNISGHNTVSSNRNQVKNSQQHSLAEEQQQQQQQNSIKGTEQ